jgi:hypothetical protein
MAVAPEAVADATVTTLAGRAHTVCGAGLPACRLGRGAAGASTGGSEACVVKMNPLLPDGLVAAIATTVLIVAPGVARLR